MVAPPGYSSARMSLPDCPVRLELAAGQASEERRPSVAACPSGVKLSVVVHTPHMLAALRMLVAQLAREVDLLWRHCWLQTHMPELHSLSFSWGAVGRLDRRTPCCGEFG